MGFKRKSIRVEVGRKERLQREGAMEPCMAC